MNSAGKGRLPSYLAEITKFQAAYRDAKRMACSRIVRLQQGATAAATTLLKVMLDQGTPANAIRTHRSENLTSRVLATSSGATQMRFGFWFDDGSGRRQSWNSQIAEVRQFQMWSNGRP